MKGLHTTGLGAPYQISSRVCVGRYELRHAGVLQHWPSI
jgi:hypothetical protein